MPESDPEAVLTVGAVARQLGVAASTLRSWQRRYGIGPTAHQHGSHRRYSPDDVQRLRRMLTLTSEGVPPAAAARVSLGQPVAPVDERDGGGSGTLAVGRSDRSVRGLARAAGRLDISAVREQVEQHIDHLGVLNTWENVLVPLLRSLGTRFERGAHVVAVEHAATAGILGALHRVPAPAQHQRLPALLCCAPEEQHGLPLEALAATLAQYQCPARFLGTRLTAEALELAAGKLRPKCVVIWAHTPHLARKVPATALAERTSTLLLAGPGCSQMHSARDYHKPQSLREAAEIILDTAAIARP